MINQPHVEMSIVLSQINVIDIIERRRLKWLGHVIRMDKKHNPYKCLSRLSSSSNKKNNVNMLIIFTDAWNGFKFRHKERLLAFGGKLYQDLVVM
jgi:hypothetical protein